MIKAIFLDIDGTMVSFNTHVISQRTCEALDKARKNGIKVFVASGRHKTAINNLGDAQFDGYMTLNGGLCYADHNELIYKRAIDKKDIHAILDYSAKHPLPMMFVKEHTLGLNFIREDVTAMQEQLDFVNVPIVDLRSWADDEVMQLIAFFPIEKQDDVMRVIPGCDSARWSPLFSDVVPHGSSKQVGVDKMIEYFGIGIDETMAFGDGGNDIPMLEHTGIGVAMGNAEDKVKQSADFVTRSVDEEGIEYALKHFGII